MYVEIAQGSVKNRNIIIPLDQLRQRMIDAREKGEELYRSYYLYDDDIIEHFKVRKTVKSYKGKYYLKEIILDIDKGDSTDKFVLERTREFVKILIDDLGMDYEHFKIFYSGRGYHIHLADYFGFEPSNHLPLEVKATLANEFPEIDTLPLMPTGLIRMAHTINSKVRRYKTRLSYEQLQEMSSEAIIELSEKGNIERVDYSRGEYNFSDKVIKNIFKREEAIEKEKPTSIVTCIQKLHAQGPVKGHRHDTMLRFISKYSRDGTPKSAVKAILKDWAPDMEPAEINKMVEDTYKKQYTFGCQDSLLKKYCDTGCIYYKNKNYTQQISTAKDMEKEFVDFARRDFSGISFDLKPILRLPNEYMFYPGEFGLIIGDTKLGKTAMAQNIAIQLPNLEIDYLCLEIPQRLLYRRNVQILHRMTKKQVFNHYNINTNSLRKGLEHIQVLPVAPNLFDLERIIGERMKPVTIIDTIDNIQVGNWKDYGSPEGKLGVTLGAIAQKLDIIIIGVHHVTKSSVKDFKGQRKRLDLHSGKGASTLEQQADKILAIEGDQNSEVREITSLGARDESPFAISCKFEKDTFRLIKIADLTIK